MIMKKDDSRDFKKEIIDKICTDLKNRAAEIHEDESINVGDQLTQMDVVWNMFKVLDHYDENIQVLQEYRRRKNGQLRFMQGRDTNE